MKESNFSSTARGFSLLELLIVLVLLSVFIMFTVIGLSSDKLYAADDQALVITDFFQEARQKALTQRKTLRVELNDTKRKIRLIDENNTNNDDDDRIIRESGFDPATSVGTKPANIDPVYSVLPQSGSPMPEIQYKQTTYALSKNDRVKTFRFTKTGAVVDGGTDNLGTGEVVSGASIYVYKGAPGSASNVIRVVTLNGVTAAAQIFKCGIDDKGICSSWTK